MTTVDRPTRRRRVYFHDLSAPAASLVVPSVFVVVRSLHGTLLLVRRCDSGAWELPGGRVDVGETAVEAAVRETAEEAGVRVEVTGFAGLFTDPGHVVRASGGEVRQQFALLFRAQAVGGTPRGDQHETCDAAWVPMADLAGLSMEPPVRIWIAQASRRQGRRTSADPETQRPERRMASRSAYHVSSPTTAVIELPTIAGQRPRRYPGSGGPRC